MAFSIIYPLVWQLKCVVSSIHAPTVPHKSGGPHPYVDPAPEKVGGQLTPWTPWLRGPCVYSSLKGILGTSSQYITWGNTHREIPWSGRALPRPAEAPSHIVVVEACTAVAYCRRMRKRNCLRSSQKTRCWHKLMSAATDANADMSRLSTNWKQSSQARHDWNSDSCLFVLNLRWHLWHY